MTSGLMKFIVKDLRPLGLVEGEGFREFLEIAVPEYEVPSRATITRMVDYCTGPKRHSPFTTDRCEVCMPDY